MTLILPMIGSGYIPAAFSQVTWKNGTFRDIANSSEYTFNADAGVGGLVGVCVSGRGAGAVTSATIDGVTATVVGANSSGNLYAAILYAEGVSSGAVSTVVTLASAATEINFVSFQISGNASNTPHDTDVVASGARSFDVSGSIDVPEGGVVVGFTASFFSSAGDNVSWTGLTEQYSQGATNTQLSDASIIDASLETGRAVTATFNQDRDCVLCLVSWS
jgi:hypothetical protein